MRRSIIFNLILTATVLAFSAVAASAQVAPLRGHVIFKQADGTTTKPANAQVDVYRVDLPGSYSTKTDKNGGFVYAGLPLMGTYVITASMPTAAPAYIAGVRVGLDTDYELSLTPGDGRRITRDEAIKPKTGGGSSGGRESAEDKARREAAEKEVEEIKKSNENVNAKNAIVADSFKAGNVALLAKNWDEAIKHYDVGLAADPEQAALLTNKAAALKGRGVDRYNASIKITEEAARNSGLESARADFKESVELVNRAFEIIKKEAAQTDPEAQKQQAANKYATLTVRSEAYRLFVTKGDSTQADAGTAAFQDYMAFETDPIKKSRAQLDLAKMLLDVGAGEKAYAEFQKILAEKPDDPDANRGAGLALFSTGDKAKYKEAANYLQRFVDKAPDTHPDKQSAKDALEYLKTSENVVPEKTTTPARPKRRP